MDKDRKSNASGILQHPTYLDVDALNSRLHQQNEAAAARSTRMIIDSASYVTTACSSPPDESRDFFTSKIGHHKAFDVTSQAESDDVKPGPFGQQEGRERTHHIVDDEKVPGKHDQEGIILAHILSAISTPDQAGNQAPNSTSQEFATSECTKDRCVAHGVSIPTIRLPQQNSSSDDPEGK